jgi:hypothetical protein
VSVSEFGDNLNGIETGIFGQCVGDDLEGLSVCLEANLVEPRERLCVFAQIHGNLNFWSSSTSNQKSISKKKKEG